MKILMATAVPPDDHSGVAGTEYRTLLALRDLGHDVEAIWQDGLRRRLRHGNLHYLLELPWAFRDAIAARCRTAAYDVIHVSQPYAWLAARDHQRRRRPGVFVNRSHGWEPRIREALKPWRRRYDVPEWRFPRGVAGRPLQWALHPYYRWCVQAADGVIVSCSEDRDYLVARQGASASKVACIPQAPAPVFVATAGPPMEAARVRHVLYAGQAAFFKAPHVLAEVFSRLAARQAGLRFTWCCPAEAHAACRRLLAGPARDQVEFIGWLPQDELVRLYDRHGIFVFPTFAEGFGKVFLEAMARGLCVVASNTAGMRDVIRSGQTGWLAEPGDVDGLCRGIELVLGAPDRALAMSAAAAETARQYSWRRVAEETTAFYRRLLAAKAAPSAAGGMQGAP